jgi:hypothetical protein
MPSTVKTATEILIKLRQNLVDSFSDTELHDLCFDMGMDYEDLPGEGRAAKARELVAYCERRGLTTELIKKCSGLRPHVSWGAPTPEVSANVQLAAPESTALTRARRTLAILEEQAAGYTALTIPAHLKIELEEKRREVADLEARLTQPLQPMPAPSPVRPASQHDVFLSYSRKDTDMMRRLLQDLRAQGLEAWIDEAGLEPGTPAWETAIGNAIENARCMVVILSPDAKESVWVGRELSYAETHQVRIFPVLARGDVRSAIPIRLTSAQFVDVRQDYSGSVQKLVTAMRRHLGM